MHTPSDSKFTNSNWLCSLDEAPCESEELGGSSKVEQGNNNKKHCKGNYKYVKKNYRAKVERGV